MNNTFTFSVGITARIIGVSPQSILAVRKAFKQPKPPMHEVEIAGQKTREADLTDTDWLEKVEEWKMELTERVQAIYFEDGLELDVDPAEVKRIAEDIRAKFAQRESPLKGSDKLIFVAHHCIRGTAELNALMKAIRGATETTEEGIAEATATFRPAGE